MQPTNVTTFVSYFVTVFNGAQRDTYSRATVKDTLVCEFTCSRPAAAYLPTDPSVSYTEILGNAHGPATTESRTFFASAVTQTNTCPSLRDSSTSFDCTTSTTAMLHTVAPGRGALDTFREPAPSPSAMSYTAIRLSHSPFPASFHFTSTSAVVFEASVASTVSCSDAAFYLASFTPSVS